VLDDEELVDRDEGEWDDHNAKFRDLFTGHHVKTDSSEGLSSHHYQAAVSILNAPPTPKRNAVAATATASHGNGAVSEAYNEGVVPSKRRRHGEERKAIIEPKKSGPTL
jgi:hypothetical protein